MEGAGDISVEGRKKALEAMKREVMTQKPGFNFSFAPDSRFDLEELELSENEVIAALQVAFFRDAAFSTAGSVHLRKIAFNGGIRAVYEGARKIEEFTKNEGDQN